MIPFPDKKFKIIYADPPWAYRDKRDKHPRLSGGASVHYNTMELHDIKNMPIHNIRDENCILFMWATFPNLQEALDVIKAWGFTYKTIGFVWIKLNKNDGKPFFGIGHYTKSNSEVCLLAIKGRPEIKSNFVSSVIMEPREGHSKKPDIIRTKIVELMGDIPRIELFARQKVEGWDLWGNEIPEDPLPMVKESIPYSTVEHIGGVANIE